MLQFVLATGRASDRRLRLFGVACCRTAWGLLGDRRSRAAVELAEQYAEGLAGAGELCAAAAEASTVAGVSRWRHWKGWTWLSLAELDPPAEWAAAAAWAVTGRPLAKSIGMVSRATCLWAEEVSESAYREELARRCTLLRCVFGNPMRAEPALDSAYLTPTVVTLATTVYEDRSFHRLPELAEALEHAGCGDAELLGHLRSEGPHCRGCWGLDLVLGKV
jgi:hypothetical protein